MHNSKGEHGSPSGFNNPSILASPCGSRKFPVSQSSGFISSMRPQFFRVIKSKSGQPPSLSAKEAPTAGSGNNGNLRPGLPLPVELRTRRAEHRRSAPSLVVDPTEQNMVMVPSGYNRTPEIHLAKSVHVATTRTNADSAGSPSAVGKL